MSNVAAYYHIVFATKWREKTIPLNMRDHLYRFIWNELTKMNCRLIRIGGIENHVHILIDLYPAVALSKVMQNIKSLSSAWMQKEGMFPHFRGWASGYYACTITYEIRDMVIEYIKHQDSHHKAKGLGEELQEICTSAGLRYDERDLM